MSDDDECRDDECWSVVTITAVVILMALLVLFLVL